MLNAKKIIILGAGGGTAFYISKLFYYLGVEVIAYDFRDSEKLIELKSLGIKTVIGNPPETNFEADMIIYSESLPENLIEELKQYNNTIFIEVTRFYRQMINTYENSNSTKLQEAFNRSNFAPLYSIDTTGIKIIGITGTKGKTMTIAILEQMLKACNKKVGIISTIEARVGDVTFDTGLHTSTPSSQDLVKYITEMKKHNVEYLILEATSIGLEAGRFSGLKFDYAIHNHIAPEHLDYHGNIENYAKSKVLLTSRYLKDDGIVIARADNTILQEYLIDTYIDKKKFILYSPKENFPSKYINNVHIELSDTVQDNNGVTYNVVISDGDNQIVINDIFIKLLGEFSALNSLSGLGVIYSEKLDVIKAMDSLKTIPQVKGRVEVIQYRPFYVIVDFAHTPDSLEAIYISARKLIRNNGKLIAIFGSAGRRDKTKRESMGKVTAEHADVTIITAEDPRTEKLSEINDQIATGWKKYISEHNLSASKTLIRFDDEELLADARRLAIKKGISLAGDGDVVVIAGKGHENSLAFGTEEVPWNDIEETKLILAI